jgi:hypothetical protein
VRAARYRVCRSLTGFDIVEPLSVNQQRIGKQAEQIWAGGSQKSEVPVFRGAPCHPNAKVCKRYERVAKAYI